VADGLNGVSGYLQNNNIQSLQTNATNYKFMRVSRQGLSVSDQTEFDTFKPVVQVKRSSIIFDSLFNIIIGNELIQDFIIRIVNTFLSKWILLNENGSITFKGATLFNENINADKMIVSKGGFIDGDIEP
jgi:hypothetical protein